MGGIRVKRRIAAWTKYGNAFGAEYKLGTTDNFAVNIVTNNTTRIKVTDAVGRTSFFEGITTRAGAAGANTAPIKITDGVLNTTPENGAVEWTNANGMFISQASIRYALGAMGSANNLENWISGRNGINTSVTGGNNVVFGINYNLAISTGFANALFGSRIEGLTTGNSNTAIGTYITMGATTQRGVFVGYGMNGVNTPGDRNIWIGTNISASGTYRNNVVIGSTPYLTGDDMCIIGSAFEDLQLKKFYLGGSQNAQGIYNDNGQYTFTWAIPERYKLVATADMPAHNLVIKGSLGTGNSTGGDITFETQDTGATGTTLRTSTARVTIKGGSGDVRLHAYPNTRIDDTELRINQISTKVNGELISIDSFMRVIDLASFQARKAGSTLMRGCAYLITDASIGEVAVYADSPSSTSTMAINYSTGEIYEYDVDTDTGNLLATFYGNKFGVFGSSSAQGATIADAAGGATVDSQSRIAINSLLATMRSFGFIAT